ncbi:MAG: NAD(P)/FAD-dependent oxidoreductase [Bdellovibrionales bacterium]
MYRCEVVVVGGGPGGSAVAAVLARANIDVLLLEKEEYPRFHIGESLLPASMPILKELGALDLISSGRYIKKLGARFIDYQSEDEIYFGFADGFNPDIPSAFEVPRAEFDRDLLENARRFGAKIGQPETVLEFELKSDGIELQTSKRRIVAEYLVDASGRVSLIGKRLKIRQVVPDLNNVAVFAHFEGVTRTEGPREGDITIGLLPDRAWTWMIPFKGNVTSVGVVASQKFFGAPDLEEYFDRMVLGSATVSRMMEGARRVTPLHCIGNYSHTCQSLFGERWLLVGDAAMFLDPVFSSGVHLSLSSGLQAAKTLIRALPQKSALTDPELGLSYENWYRKGVGRFHNLISLFYQGHFVGHMKKTLIRENMRKCFTSALAGDVWNDNNFLFEKQIL